MRRFLLAAAAAVILGGPAIADVRPTAPAPASSDEAFQLLLSETGAALDSGDNAQARQLLEQAWRSPAFAAQPAQMRHDILVMIARLAGGAHDWQAARTAIFAATQMAEATGADWTIRREVVYRAGDKAQAIADLTTIATRFPKSLAAIDDQTIAYVMNEARGLPNGAALRFSLIDAVFTAGWTTQNPFEDLSSLRQDYAAGLLAHGRTADAEKVIRLITKSDALITMRADKRFDGIGGTRPERFSPKAGELARLEQTRALAKTHPDRLAGQIAQAEALIALNQADKALAIVEAAIAKATADPDAYVDTERQLGWAHNVRKTALDWLGRRDEALEALAIGARVPDHGQPNVNQTLNLAFAQVEAGQARAALATVDSVRLTQMSPYGQAVALKTKVCAAAGLGDAKLAQSAMTALLALGEASKGAALAALLCKGDLDGAAALVIERLRDPEQRSYTLLVLQRGPPSPHPTTYDTDREAKLEALRARPDVKAAVDAVGRIVTYRAEDLWTTP